MCTIDIAMLFLILTSDITMMVLDFNDTLSTRLSSLLQWEVLVSLL